MFIPNKAHFTVISAPKNLNSFMEAADLFEQGKVLGFIDDVVITYKPDTELTLAHAAGAINHLQNAYESMGYLVSLVNLDFVERGNIIERNNGIIAPYWNKDVRIISTGHKWYMLCDFLTTRGYRVQTNEFRYIIGVSQQ